MSLVVPVRGEMLDGCKRVALQVGRVLGIRR